MLRALRTLALLLPPFLPPFLPAAAAARDISGAVTIRERIALPAGAEVVVVLNDAAGPVTELRLALDGRQAPVPFTLAGAPEAALTLRAVIRIDGRPAFVSAPLAIVAGSDPVALGEIVARRATPMGFASTFACGTVLLRAGFGESGMVLERAGEVRRLKQVESASGARYSDGGAAETSFWSKGDRATVVWDGEALAECTEFATPDRAPLRATGNEPSWLLEAEAGGVRFVPMQGAEIAATPLPDPVLAAEGLVYTVPGGLVFTLAPGPCSDTMSGMPHPVTVTVTVGGATLRGCGGDPAALLQGRWRVIAVAGAAVPEGVAASMEFSGPRVAGSGGCNRYTGSVTLTGEGLSFGAVASTRMACPDPQAATEAALFAAMREVTGFAVTAEGIDLLAAGTPAIRLAR